MSIHHEVTIHCDSCGQWDSAGGRDLTRFGWARYRNGDGRGPTTGGHLDAPRHLCPTCAASTQEGKS